jgi:hypothetical protein
MKAVVIIGIVFLTAAGSVRAGTEAAALFETARQAVDQGQYKEALETLAQISVFHSRDPEWVPAAVFYEGLVYKQTGHPEAARHAAEELLLGWPDSAWSRRAGELKQ